MDTNKPVRPFVCVAVSLLLAACGGGNGGGGSFSIAPAATTPPSAVAPPVTTTPTAAATPSEQCAALKTFTVSAGGIAFPTNGASVISTALQAKETSLFGVEYCKVLLKIAPADSAAPGITMQVNLPTEWNHKAIHFGGGGLNGFLVTGERTIPGGAAQPAPLSKGYVTFGSDGGFSTTKPGTTETVQAYLNDEVLDDYSGDQLKKTRDVAVALVKARYQASPDRTYFMGESGGGHDGLIVAQRFPLDYDGVVSYFPAIGGTPMALNFGRISRALAAPGAYPNVAKQKLLHDSVVAACDSQDGVADGVISAPQRCAFDVNVLRCPGGADTGDTCLSDAQIAALNVMASPFTLPYSIASGETHYGGTNVYSGVDLTAPASGLGVEAPAGPDPILGLQPGHFYFFDIIAKALWMRDPNADSLLFDPESPGAYLSRVSSTSMKTYAGNPDLSAFSRRGGKLIIVHGNDDSLINVGTSAAYYRDVVNHLGQAAVNDFMRFYQVPGYGHGSGNFIVDWDSLTALEGWVEKNQSVDQPVARDVNPATAGRTRPFCAYPSWPQFTGGSGADANSAANFACVTS